MGPGTGSTVAPALGLGIDVEEAGRAVKPAPDRGGRSRLASGAHTSTIAPAVVQALA